MCETIINLKLEPCCYKTIKGINQRIKNAKLLAATIGGYSIFNMFFSYPGGGAIVSSTSTIYTVTKTDWLELSNVLTSIGKIARREAANDAGVEVVKHQSDNNLKCRLFWEGVYESFL